MPKNHYASRRAIAFLCALSLAGGVGVAQDAAETIPSPGDRVITRAEHIARFEAMDTNGDDQVTSAERRAFLHSNREKRRLARFQRLDKDGDGVLSREEALAAKPHKRPKRHKRRHGQPDKRHANDKQK